MHYDVKGHDCVKWSYAADDQTLHYMEDAAHGGYDLLIFRDTAAAATASRKSDCAASPTRSCTS